MESVDIFIRAFFDSSRFIHRFQAALGKILKYLLIRAKWYFIVQIVITSG